MSNKLIENTNLLQELLLDVDAITSDKKVQNSAYATLSYDTQTILPNDGYDALAQVVIQGDQNLVPENIKSGVTICGVTGTAKGGFPNGTSWTQSNISDIPFKTVMYEKGVWVADSDGSGLYYSHDGKTWMQSNLPLGGSHNHIAYGNGIWVANRAHLSAYPVEIMTSFGLWYSQDGITWTQSNVTENIFGEPFYANGFWIAGSSDGLYKSDDGITWSKAGSLARQLSNTSCEHGVYFTTPFRAVRPGYIINDYTHYSTDGINWVNTNGTYGTPKYINGLWYTNGLKCSADGITWTDPVENVGRCIIEYANGLFVAASISQSSTGNGVVYSTDGINWSLTNLPILSRSSWNDLLYANGIWVISISTAAYYSVDGITWTQSDNKGKSLYNANGVWVSGSSSYSVDGKTWHETGQNIVFKEVLYADGIWVACGETGLYYSVAWEPPV